MKHTDKSVKHYSTFLHKLQFNPHEVKQHLNQIPTQTKKQNYRVI